MWYRTGTITLKKGTTKVLGTGTKWTDKLSNVESGQPLIVNGNIYEITEVRSDTELYIKETALADATATPYVIMSVVYGSLGDVALKASKALAHYQEQMDVFDMMYTGTQAFKVTKPDGSEIEMYPYSMLSVDLAKLNQTLQTVATHAANAKTSETNAKSSATSASTSATSASSSATTATASANAASLSAATAKTSETKAKEYADSVNANSLLTKADNLKSVANLSEAQKNMQIFRNAGDLSTKNLNSLNKHEHIGVYYQLYSASATIENNYPFQSAGCLIVMPSAYYSCIQIYTAFSTGRMFTRSVVNTNGDFNQWTEYANLSLPNTFTGGSVESFNNGMNFIAKTTNQGQAAYYSVRDADDTNIGYFGKAGLTYNLAITNQKVGTNLILKEDGKLYYSNNEVLHTGNAGVHNGIGSTATKTHTISNYPGNNATVTGETLGGGLSGTWKVVSAIDTVSIAGTVYKNVTYKRIN